MLVGWIEIVLVITRVGLVDYCSERGDGEGVSLGNGDELYYLTTT